MCTATRKTGAHSESTNLWQKLEGYHQAWYPRAKMADLVAEVRKGAVA